MVGWFNTSLYWNIFIYFSILSLLRISNVIALTEILFLTVPITGYIAFPASSSANSKNTRALERICLSHLRVLEYFSFDLNRTASSALQYEVCMISSQQDCSLEK